MNKPMITFLLLFLFTVFSFSQTENLADPNYPGIGFSYSDALSLKIGETFQKHFFLIGGLIEVRNEPRFNEDLLPNHNWRGFGFAGFQYPVTHKEPFSLILQSRYEHESAHATMGIAEPTKKAYEQIYDKNYRNIDLNGIHFISSLLTIKNKSLLQLRMGYQFYFLSKNTPELPNLQKTFSNGFSLQSEFQYKFDQFLNVFISIHDRFIMDGKDQSTGDIYFNNNHSLEKINSMYPIINQINTLSISFGITHPLKNSRKAISIYVQYLHGNIYGYVDSRENRSLFSVGVLFGTLKLFDN
jgi:hypothetical protein